MTRPRRGTPTAIGLGALTLLGAMAAAIEVLKLVNHWLTEPEALECEGRWRSGYVGIVDEFHNHTPWSTR